MKKIAVLTNMMDFSPGYSLTGIVKDQVRMLTEHGHEVHLFVNSRYHGDAFDPQVTLHKSIPFAHLHDFQSMEELKDPSFSSKEGKNAKYFTDLTDATAKALAEELRGFDVAFTHDFVFIGWFMPYGLACARAGKELPGLRWMHWIHSVPTGRRDYWDMNLYGRAHKLIYPNVTQRVRVCEAFNGRPDDVRVIPHIKDMRTWMDFDPETCRFITDYPAAMQADVVMVYPASVDRLEAKRVREVLLIFSKIKRAGRSVFLAVANQWTTNDELKQKVSGYKELAGRLGLTYGEEVVFTSDWQVAKDASGRDRGKYEVGLPSRILRELMQCANLFIFPTKEETFGLVMPEAALAGGVLLVLNRSLLEMQELSGYKALYFAFGSFENGLNIADEDLYFGDLAKLILGRMDQDESITVKTWFRQKNNWDSLYNRYYAPIMGESLLWEV